MTTTADSADETQGAEGTRPVPGRSPGRGARIARMCLRSVATLAAVDGLVQAALAGKFISGNYDALDLHGTNSNILTALTIAVLLVSLEDRRLARGRWWPVIGGVALVVAVGAQSSIGWADVLLELHVPLGVTVVAGLIMMAVWSWRAPLVAAQKRPVETHPVQQPDAPDASR
ncbi:hypothetical protein G4X40_06205 [Rhodococcus sp. D2-41]|uniref:Uncharacterized protein n=1 Tax=Speluncibacter jeojiensis TaxID=2710754 RepID=A0A9X4LZI3_9ACTN|nr:hypothetical protein [Rhodococcus sp. D2-41]MDG3009737.1 hypothetical protein [Rhodococcus sp. D2-41]MDG3014486.1 hypothetical protein [Corynebacteriales bacterium D3-21]